MNFFVKNFFRGKIKKMIKTRKSCTGGDSETLLLLHDFGRATTWHTQFLNWSRGRPPGYPPFYKFGPTGHNLHRGDYVWGLAVKALW